MKTVGYIILDEHGAPLALSRYEADGPQVLTGACGSREFAQLFSRAEAKAALNRSATYAAQNNLPWAVGEFRIVRVAEESR